MSDTSDPEPYRLYTQERCSSCARIRTRVEEIDGIVGAGYANHPVIESADGEVVAEGHGAVDDLLAEESDIGR